MSIFKFKLSDCEMFVTDSAEAPGALLIGAEHNDDYAGVVLPREQVEKLYAALGKWLHVGKHDWQGR